MADFEPRQLIDGPATFKVAQEVIGERVKQDAKWGQQNHADGTGKSFREAADRARYLTDQAAKDGTTSWRLILQEEVYEAFAEDNPILLREELLQVAAVASAWAEAIDRRKP